MREAKPTSWWRWPVAVPTAAAVLLAAALAYQWIPRVPPTSPPTELVALASPDTVVGSESRAEGVKHITEGSVGVDVPPDAVYPSYGFYFRNNAGRVFRANDLKRAETSNSVTIGVRSLPAGSYELVVEGVREDGNRLPIISIPVVIEVR